ncbi:MAG: hypothetical protein D6732_12150 [Methanobacteriota archaeon]|nr:MAG: hypothetical protein D6732_12150 [Euryarchaeota archaeon]
MLVINGQIVDLLGLRVKDMKILGKGKRRPIFQKVSILQAPDEKDWSSLTDPFEPPPTCDCV